jgi:hypothetical protein
MKTTVVFEDSIILVDGVPKSGFVFTGVDSNWRVIQWRDDYGWIEVHSGERVWLSDITVVQPFIDMWIAQPLPEPPVDPDPEE